MDTSKMLKDSKFIKKYKKDVIKVLKESMPDVDTEIIKDEVNKMIEENFMNPEVTLDNNYTGESRDTTLLSVLEWALERKPILCGNATFYKNQYEAMNPIAKMLEGFLTQRKAYKKKMFKVEDTSSSKYKDLDRLQLNEKINANSYYGGSGAQSSAFYSTWSGPATTHTAQEVISTAESLFEGFVGDNYLFLDMNECVEWINTIIKPFKKEEEAIEDFIQPKSINEVLYRLVEKVIDVKENDEEFLYNYLLSFTDEELSVIYYKNNLIEFIRDHQKIQDLIYTIFNNVENLEYSREYEENEDDSLWYTKVDIPKKYIDKARQMSWKDWNKFVDNEYFLDPNSVPDSVAGVLDELKNQLMKYVYCQYLSVDRIYRLKNFKRNVVTVIDTDSNILSLDTSVDFIMNEVIGNEDFNRDHLNNIFICINMLAYVLTEAVTDILLTFGKNSNIPEEFRPIFNMKNEFLFLKLIIGKTKKRYISKIVLREGNRMNPPKYDVKGFDLKKSSCSEESEEFYMKLIKKYIINCEGIDIKGMLKELKKFKEDIRDSIKKGEHTYLPKAAAKEIASYKQPASEQSVRGVLTWNMLFPENLIELPTKVSLLKLNIFDEEDIEDLKDAQPEFYNIIIDKIFNDETGMFVTKTYKGLDYVDVNDPEWYSDLPSKYKTKYKKLGPEEWNKYVDECINNDEAGYYEIKKRGMQVIAIPSNGKIPEWLDPYIDYSTVINNIIAPFIPVLEIFKSKTIDEGKTRKGVNRKTTAFTNIIKF